MSDEQQAENTQATDGQQDAQSEPVAEATFTQEDVDRIVRDRVQRERSKFADYDALKAKVGEAQSAEEKAEARIKDAEQRAAELEAANDRKGVALEFQLTSEDAGLLDHLTDTDAMRALAQRLARQAQEDAAPRRPQPNPAQHEGDSPINDKDAQARAFFGI